MALQEELGKQGEWLFRWRSFLPVLVVPLVILGLRASAGATPGKEDSADTLHAIGCIAISFFGMAIRAITIGFIPRGTSGTVTRIQRADTLNTTGIYAFVRHPLYLGNFFVFFGIVLFPQVWWLAVIGILLFWLYYERIMYKEEQFLREKFGTSYLEWAEKTPAFIPRFGAWHKPDARFSWWRIVRRDYIGVFEITVCFFLLQTSRAFFKTGSFTVSSGWVIFFSAGCALFATVRTVKAVIRGRKRRNRAG